MQYQFDQFIPEQFLSQYWQKKPVLIKSAFVDFQDPISPDELAGLALESDIESRVIQHKNDNWQVTHGPFEDYAQFGETNWTLLVQAVDHWLETGNDLLRPFRFIPNWRVDDLMISFSTPNGGVGPHLDQYDVFIIQGQGKRHWRVGLPQTLDEKIPHPDLLQVSEFEACIDAVLELGDMLYIPPNCPHQGYAIEPSLNYSVGFRAPNQQDLLSSFADFALQESCFNKRYSDPHRTLSPQTGELTQQDSNALIDLVKACLNDSTKTNQWLGCYLTQAKHELAVDTPEPEFENSDIIEINQQIDYWQRLGGLRSLIIEQRLYANGEAFELTPEQISFAQWLTHTDQYPSVKLKSFLCQANNALLFKQLVNLGYVYPVEC